MINRKARPPVPVPVEARLRRRRLRVAHDALDRHHRAALPRLPPDGSHVGQRQPAVRARRSVQQPRVQPAAARRRDRLRRRQHRARRSTCTTAPGRCSRAWASTTRAINKLRRRFAQGFAAFILSATSASRSRCSCTSVELEVSRTPNPPTAAVQAADAVNAMTLDSKIPAGPLEEKWDNHKFDDQAREPGEQAPLRHHRRRHRPRRRVGGRDASAELGYKVKVVTFHDSPRACALDRRAGRHQRRQELPERRRQHLPPLLRHDQGRRLPLPRGERVPARAGVGRHHRPVRRAGRAVRPRVRRPARQPLASAARRCRARSTHGARPASSCCSARTRRSCAQVHSGSVHALPAHRDARPRRQGRPHRRHRVPRPRTPARCSRCRATRSCSRPAATATSSTSRPTRRTRNVTAAWRAAKKGAYFANPCYTQIHPTCIPASDDFQSKLTLMSESLRNDGRIWVPEEDGRHALAPTRSPKPTATTSSSAATRRSATSCRATSRRVRSSARSTPAAASGR